MFSTTLPTISLTPLQACSLFAILVLDCLFFGYRLSRSCIYESCNFFEYLTNQTGMLRIACLFVVCCFATVPALKRIADLFLTPIFVAITYQIWIIFFWVLSKTDGPLRGVIHMYSANIIMIGDKAAHTIPTMLVTFYWLACFRQLRVAFLPHKRSPIMWVYWMCAPCSLAAFYCALSPAREVYHIYDIPLLELVAVGLVSTLGISAMFVLWLTAGSDDSIAAELEAAKNGDLKHWSGDGYQYTPLSVLQ